MLSELFSHYFNKNGKQMKFMKTSIVVAGILLITSGLISCVGGQSRGPEDPEFTNCTDPSVKGVVVESGSTSQIKSRPPKAPIQTAADCSDQSLKD